MTPDNRDREPHINPETPAQIEERICSCGAGHGSGESHMGWCDFVSYQALPPAPLPGAPGGEADFTMRDVRCAKCGMVFESGKAYGWVCQHSPNCGPMEPVGEAKPGFFIPTTLRDRPTEPADVDWEQRRWDLARAILSGWCANPQVIVNPETSPGAALELADELIAAAQEDRP